MNCPNCGIEMKNTYNNLLAHDIYSCKKCKITYTNIANTKKVWDIPEKFRPTEKQRKTILFINHRLHINLEAITRHQCRIDIGKHFDAAKNAPEAIDGWYDDLQECF